MEQYGISKLDLKRRNRMQILKLLQQQGPTSRIDLSGALELTRAAVTIITNEMIEQGVLYEKGEINLVGQKASRGRKKVLIDINRNFKFAFGIAIDRKRAYIGLSNIGGDTLEKRSCEIRANDDKDSILQQIFVHMQEMLANNCLEKSQLMGIGICLGEWAVRLLELRTENGIVDYSPLQQLFTKSFGLPVICDSIINGLAIAEIDFSEQMIFGDPTVLIRFTDQVEATMVVGNEIYRGAHHRAMNFAHLTVRPNGRLCHCGKRGCLSSECSEDSIYVDIVNAFSAEKTPLLYERMGGNPNLLRVAELSEYVLLGDEAIMAMFDERLESIGVFFNNLIAVTDPQRIVFFGNQFESEQYVARLKEYITNTLGEQATELITVGSLKQENIYLSGCALASRRFFIDKGGLEHEHHK